MSQNHRIVNVAEYSADCSTRQLTFQLSTWFINYQLFVTVLCRVNRHFWLPCTQVTVICHMQKVRGKVHYKTAGTVGTARYMTVGRLQSDNYGSAILCITTAGLGRYNLQLSTQSKIFISYLVAIIKPKMEVEVLMDCIGGIIELHCEICQLL